MGCEIPFSLSFLLMFTSIKINKITLNYGRGGEGPKAGNFISFIPSQKGNGSCALCRTSEYNFITSEYEARIALIVIVGSWFEMSEFLSKCCLWLKVCLFKISFYESKGALKALKAPLMWHKVMLIVQFNNIHLDWQETLCVTNIENKLLISERKMFLNKAY